MIKEAIKYAIQFILIGACVMLGMRAVEYLIAKPSVYYYICIQEVTEDYACVKKKE